MGTPSLPRGAVISAALQLGVTPIAHDIFQRASLVLAPDIDTASTDSRC